MSSQDISNIFQGLLSTDGAVFRDAAGPTRFLRAGDTQSPPEDSDELPETMKKRWTHVGCSCWTHGFS